MKSDYLDSIQHAKRAYSRVLEPVCKQWELTQKELDILLFLYNNPRYNRAVDIVNLRGITKSHVSMSVSSLEEKKMLLCNAHPTDRRIVHLVLTDTGKRVAAYARQIQESFFETLYEGVDPEDLAVWNRVRDQISKNILKL